MDTIECTNGEHLLSIDTFYSVQWVCKQTVKALIRLHRYTVWSGPLLSAYAWRHVFAWRGPYKSLMVQGTLSSVDTPNLALTQEYRNYLLALLFCVRSKKGKQYFLRLASVFTGFSLRKKENENKSWNIYQSTKPCVFLKQNFSTFLDAWGIIKKLKQLYSKSKNILTCKYRIF